MIGFLNTQYREVTVIGAGISGLLAAYFLDKAGYEVTLIEASDRGGGLIRTTQTELGIAESAAHSLLVTPRIQQVFDDLKVPLAPVRPDSRARYILRGGEMRRFPLTLGEAAGTLRRFLFARAPRVPETAANPARDLESWAKRHLGEAATRHLLTPFTRGVYGIEPALIGVDAAFPVLATQPGQTLFKAIRSNLKASRKSAPGKKTRRKMMAPLRGMGDLVGKLDAHLEQRLGGRYRKGVTIENIPEAANVILATPAHVASRQLTGIAPELSEALSKVVYTPMISVTAFADRPAHSRPIRGVGVLVSASEPRDCLGILFNSSSFEARVRDEKRHASYTLMLGGSSRPELLERTDSEIRDIVSNELREIIGLRERPADLLIHRWQKAIPQYSPELPLVWQLARETWCSRPGRILFGNYSGQVSLRGMIEDAEALAFLGDA